MMRLLASLAGMFKRPKWRDGDPWDPDEAHEIEWRLRDAKARQQGKCLDGSPRRETHVVLTEYKIVGKVFRDGQDGLKLLASSEITKPGESAAALKDAWERDMKAEFPQGPDYNIILDCVVREATTRSTAGTTATCPMCGKHDPEHPFIAHAISCYRKDCGEKPVREGFHGGARSGELGFDG